MIHNNVDQWQAFYLLYMFIYQSMYRCKDDTCNKLFSKYHKIYHCKAYEVTWIVIIFIYIYWLNGNTLKIQIMDGMKLELVQVYIKIGKSHL